MASNYKYKYRQHSQTKTHCVVCNKDILTISMALCEECRLTLITLINENKAVQRYLRKLFKLERI